MTYWVEYNIIKQSMDSFMLALIKEHAAFTFQDPEDVACMPASHPQTQG